MIHAAKSIPPLASHPSVLRLCFFRFVLCRLLLYIVLSFEFIHPNFSPSHSSEHNHIRQREQHYNDRRFNQIRSALLKCFVHETGVRPSQPQVKGVHDFTEPRAECNIIPVRQSPSGYNKIQQQSNNFIIENIQNRFNCRLNYLLHFTTLSKVYCVSVMALGL